MDTYDFTKFQDIIRTLRSEDGCPWDREQTHKSLRPCIIEEAAEVAASIRVYEQTGDDSNLKEELGDVLLQVLMHSQIAEEEGRFTVEDVIAGISEKMIRRHPHVFGSGRADNAEQVLETWDAIKSREKAAQPWVKSELREIPIELPALTRAQKIWKKGKKLHGCTISAGESAEAIRKNLDDILAESGLDKDKAEGKMGQLLLHCANLAESLQINGEEALTEASECLINTMEQKRCENP